MVKHNIQQKWDKTLKEKACTQTSLKYMNIEACGIGKVHPLWRTVDTNKLDVMRGMVKAKLLTGKYLLQAGVSVQSGGRISPICLLCCEGPENREHFIVTCQSLQRTRGPYINSIGSLLEQAGMSNWREIRSSPVLLTHLVLDCSHPRLHIQAEVQLQVERETRRLCYALHSERALKQKLLQRSVPGASPHTLMSLRTTTSREGASCMEGDCT
jgi:hypothetical protein